MTRLDHVTVIEANYIILIMMKKKLEKINVFFSS